MLGEQISVAKTIRGVEDYKRKEGVNHGIPREPDEEQRIICAQKLTTEAAAGIQTETT